MLIEGGYVGKFFVWAGSRTRREWPKMLRKFAEKERERKDIIITFDGTCTLNRFTQIHNDTTLNTCNISNNVNIGNEHEKGGSRSDTIGSKGSCDAAKSHG